VEALRRETLLPVQLLACVLPFAIVPLWFGGDWLIQRFYSPYSASVWPMKVLLLAFYFLVVNGGVTTFLFTIDKQRRNLLIAGPALAFNVVLDVLLLRQGLGILGVALGSLVTYIAYAFVHLSYVASHFQLTRREWLRFFAEAFLPGGCLAIILAGIDWMAPPGGSFVRAALCTVLSWVLVAPLAARALRLARRIDAASEDAGALAVRR
jgi:O-antigen/teichoic acid export membrane protein